MNSSGKPSLADVDGTEPGKVQLVSIRLVDEFDADPKMMHSYFEESAEHEHDPWLRAEGLRESIQRDWPEHYWAIVGNWRARYLKWRRLQQNLGFLGENAWTPEAYLEAFD